MKFITFITFISSFLSLTVYGMEYSPSKANSPSSPEKKFYNAKKQIFNLVGDELHHSRPIKKINFDHEEKKELSLIFNTTGKNILNPMFEEVNEVLDTHPDSDEDDLKKSIVAVSAFPGDKFAKAIKKLDSDVEVDVLSGPGGYKIKSELPTIDTQPGVHAKVLAAKATNSIVFGGSFNFSNNFSNYESMFKTNDTDIYDQFISVFNKYKKGKIDTSRTIQTITPQKPKIISTQETKVLESQAQRLERFMDSTHPDDFFILSTMTLNDESFCNKLFEVLQARKDHSPITGLIFLDITALNNPDIIEHFISCGVHVYIVNEESIYPGSKVRKIQHSKIFARVIEDQLYVEVGTGNVTKESNEEFNVTLCIPNKNELLADIVTFFTTIEPHFTKIKDSNHLDEITQAYNNKKRAQSDRQKEKRKQKREEEKSKKK